MQPKGMATWLRLPAVMHERMRLPVSLRACIRDQKVWPLGREYVLHTVRKTLENLGTGYIDLYLLHSPFVAEATGENDAHIRAKRHESWQAMEELHQQGVVRNLGVANFEVRQLRALRSIAKVQPVLNQVEFHVYYQNWELIRYCWKHGILVQGYGSVGGGVVHPHLKRPLEEQAVRRIAARHRVQPSQILLRYALLCNIAVAVKSSSESRLASNLDLFSFDLDDRDIEELRTLDELLPLYPTHHNDYP